MTSYWNQGFSDLLGPAYLKHDPHVTMPTARDEPSSFVNRLKAPQLPLNPVSECEARNHNILHHFADTLCTAMQADACAIFEQCGGERLANPNAFNAISICSFFRACGDAAPSIVLPDKESDLHSVSLGSSGTVYHYTRSLAPDVVGPMGRYSQVLHVSFRVDPARVWAVQLYRSSSDRTFDEDIETRLLPMLPLVIDQAVLLTRCRSNMATEAVGRHLADQMSFGLFCLDAHCQLIWSNNAARGIIENSDTLAEQNGHISIRRRHENALMHAHVAKVCEEQNASYSSYMVMEAVHSASARPYLFHILPGGGIVGRVCAFLLVFNPEISLARALTPVCQALGLSPSESRLAIALSDGASLKEAACSLGLKEYTARTYLKQIFSKLRVQRQADLVRVLLKSALPFSSNSAVA